MHSPDTCCIDAPCVRIVSLSDLAVVLILLSALFHAGWNLAAKRASPTAAFFLIANLTGACIFSPWVFVYPGIIYHVPADVWSLLVLTGLFQALYCIALAASYRHGDLSVSYPVSRSLPVVIVPLVTFLLGRGKLLGGWFIAGAVLILSGAALVSLKELKTIFSGAVTAGKTLPMAVLAASGIAGYSMVDDRALKILRGSMGDVYGTVPITLVYAFLESVVCTGCIAAFVFVTRKSIDNSGFSRGQAASAGLLMYLTYSLVLVSMAYARDISFIVAFRQVSVLAGALMGFVLLKEHAGRGKVLGLTILFTGLVIVALG